MIICEICGASFKSTQGLAGHKRLRHGASRPGEELQKAFGGKQLHRRVINSLADKLADRLAEAILEATDSRYWIYISRSSPARGSTSAH